VRFTGTGAETHSVVMRSRSGTVRFIRARHRFSVNPDYGPRRPQSI
jgi:fructose-1,6-bisphosphatase II